MSDIYTDGNIAATGNITTTNSNLQAPQGSIYVQANVVAAGQIYADGNIYGNATLLVSNAAISGDIAVGSISTDTYNYANGDPIPLNGLTYTNANVAAFLPTYTGTLATTLIELNNTSVTLGANVGSGNEIIAIGADAAASGAGDGVIAIGNAAGQNNAGANAIYIGNNAGRTHGVTSGQNMVAIGAGAGGFSQGGNAVAIGYLAGASDQANNSIVLNATGVPLDAGYSGTFIAPLREDDANVTNGVYYNNVTKELLIGVNPTSNGSNGIYSNTEVQAFLNSGTLAGNIVPGTTNLYTLGTASKSWANIYTDGTLVIKGQELTVDAGSNLTYNSQQVVLTDPTGNITANYFLGNGSALTGMYGNANVATYLPTYTGNLPVVGNITTVGNVTAVNFIGNGAQLTGMYGNAQVANYLPNYSGNLNSVTSIVAVANITATNMFADNITATGDVDVVGNVTADFFIGDGSLLTGLPASYTDANVAAFLPTYTGNLAGGNLTVVGNSTAAYFIGNGSQLTGLPAGYANSNVANFLPNYTGVLKNLTSVESVGNITTLGNFIGNGAALTGVYANANVANYLPGYTGNLNSVGNLTVVGKTALGVVANVAITGGNVGEVLTTDGTGNLSWLANPVFSVPPVYLVAPIAGNNQMFSNTILASYNSNTDMTVFYNGSLLENTYYTLAGDELTVNIPLLVGDGIDVVKTVAGNVTSIVSSGYGNSNVAAYLPFYTGGMPAMTGAVTTVGNVSGANVIGGNIRLTGETISSTQDTITIDPLNDGTSAGNVIVAGSMTIQGNLTYNDVVNATTTDLLWISANDAASSSLASGGGLGVGPSGSYATFTFNSGANVWQSSLPLVATGGANLNGALTGATTGLFTGNVTADYYIGNGSLLTGLYSNVEASAYLASGTDTAGIVTVGNVSANVVTANTVSAVTAAVSGNATFGNIATVGNVTAGYFIGNGSQLTGLPASYTDSDVSTYLISGNDTAGYDTSGPINAASVATSGDVGVGGELTVASNAVVSGNVTATYYIGDGSQLTGLPVTYTNANVEAFLPGYTGNLNSANTITATGNINAQHFYGNGAGLTGMYGNANVANYLPSYSGSLNNVVNVVASGNVTASFITATSNIAGLNIASTGNLSGGNITTAGTVIATGNITGGNLTAIANVTAVNVNATNVAATTSTVTTANVSGNVNAGNLRATGTVTATNIGNVAAVNLNGLVTKFLAGDGTWQTAGGSGGGGLRNITKVEQAYGFGTQFILADGRLLIAKGTGASQAYVAGLYPTDPSVALQSGINNLYELPFIDETPGTIVDVGEYGASAYALFANGNLYTWGYNGYGQLGIGSTTNSLFPILSNTSVAQVYITKAQGEDYARQRIVIRKSNNTYFGCGGDDFYQFGLGTTTIKTSWTALPWIPADALSVWLLGGVYGNIFVQKADGNILVTGYNAYGQLGIGNNITPTTPQLAGGWVGGDYTMRITQIGYGAAYNDGSAQNYENISMLLDNGTTSRLVGAGANNWGTLGTGNTTNSNVPVAPLAATGLTGRITKIASVGNAPRTMYALLSTGTVFSWGYNGYGAVGNGTTTQANTPYLLTTGVTDMIGEIQGGDVFGWYMPSPYFKKSTGYYACGYNSYGNLGDGTRDQQNSLVRLRVPVSVEFKFFAVYGYNNGMTRLGITTNNTIWAWGYNDLGAIDPLQTAWTAVQPLEFVPNALRSI